MTRSSIVHLSVDGPLNHKFYRDLKEYCEREKLPEMIKFGSCNLLIQHGAFKSGFESTDWEMKILLKSCYQILHGSPARRDDYISIARSTKFPLAFCSTRWVEDKPVADRDLEIWPNIVKTVKCCTSLPKSKQPKGKSLGIVSKAVNDVLTPLKLSFSIYMASLFHPFVKKYQNELPLMPFLCDDLTKVLKKVLQIIIQDEKLDCNGKDFPKINLNENSNSNLRSSRNGKVKTWSAKMIFKSFMKWSANVLKLLHPSFSRKAH